MLINYNDLFRRLQPAIAILMLFLFSRTPAVNAMHLSNFGPLFRTGPSTRPFSIASTTTLGTAFLLPSLLADIRVCWADIKRIVGPLENPSLSTHPTFGKKTTHVPLIFSLNAIIARFRLPSLQGYTTTKTLTINIQNIKAHPR